MKQCCNKSVKLDGDIDKRPKNAVTSQSMSLIIAASILAIAQIGGLFLAAKVIISYVERKQAEIASRATEEILRLLKGEPCQAASVLMAIGQTVGREAGRSAKTSIMADLGNVANAQKMAGQDQQLALINEANPQLGAVLDGMGKRGGKMLGNPLVQLALNALIGSKGNTNHGESKGGTKSPFEL